MDNALYWIISTFGYLLNGLNFSITIGQYSFGLLEFFLATFLLGILVRNFVHTAR